MKKSILCLSVAASLLPLTQYAAVHTITDLADHNSPSKALYVRAGDTIELPELATGESYAVLHEGVASLEGTTVTILEPGILGIERLSEDGAKSDVVAAVLALPDPIGNGRIFVYNSNHWDNRNWSNPAIWSQPGIETNTDYPHLPNDIAIMGFVDGHSFEMNVARNVSLGGLMMGYYKMDKGLDAYMTRLRGVDAEGSTLTFERTDGEPVWIRYYNNSTALHPEWRVNFGFGNDSARPLTVVLANDVVVDTTWTGTDLRKNQIFVRWYPYSTLEIPKGRTLTFVRPILPTGDGSFLTVAGKGTIRGAGTILNTNSASFLFDFADASKFTGTIVEASKGYKGYKDYDRSGNTWFNESDTVDHASLSIHGYVVRTDGGKKYSAENSAGYAKIGKNHTYDSIDTAVGNRLPGHEVTMQGGFLDLRGEKKTWSDPDAKVLYQTEHLNLPNGLGYISVEGPASNTTYPEVLFSANTVSRDNKAALLLNCNGLFQSGGNNRTHVQFPWMADEAIGGIVPWFAAHMDIGTGNKGAWAAVRFPIADEDGFLHDSGSDSVKIDDAAPGANVFSDGKDLTLTADRVVNSLVVKNRYNNNKKLGAGRTLTITSGGLILEDNATGIGLNDWKNPNPSSSNGSIVFGNTAYVFGTAFNESDPDWIIVPMTAPYGFVSAFPGRLCIGGDQTGIDGEIVVQAGTLMLGFVRNDVNGTTLVAPCTIDVPVRIVGGGSTLAIADIADAAPALDPKQDLFFDDLGGFSGKLVIPAGKTEKCRTLYTRNSLESNEWTCLERGTYGASGSGADFIDDTRFAGGGILQVMRDDLVRPTVIFVR